jgi:hypothetical protein
MSKIPVGLCLSHATREHAPFILDTFRKSVIDLGAMHPELASAHKLGVERDLRGRCRCIVASPIGHPETYLGWAAEAFGSLLFAYTGLWNRREGIGAQMVSALFTGGPVRLVYWTDTAAEIQEHGFPLVHDWREYARRERVAEQALERRYQHRERMTA